MAGDAVDYAQGCRLMLGNLVAGKRRELTRRQYESLSDGEIVALTLRGDSRSYEAIVRRYQKLVYNVCYQVVQSHETAADVTQDTFIKAYRALSSFRPEAPFKPWLLRIATNTALNKIRDEKHRDHESLDVVIVEKTAPEPASTENVAEQVEWRLSQAMLNDALTRLSPRMRHVFLLHYQYELSYAEICTITGESESAIKSLLFRTRERLREMLDDQIKTGGGYGS